MLVGLKLGLDSRLLAGTPVYNQATRSPMSRYNILRGQSANSGSVE